jgi:precorrin-2 methylase
LLPPGELLVQKEVITLSHRLEDKQIAKEIVIEMLKNNAFIRSEYPKSSTVEAMICQAYKEILKTIAED